MDEHEQPCLGPPPGGLPDVDPDLDLEWAEYTAWLDRETAAGHDTGPGPWDPEDDEEPEDSAASWEVWRPGFGQSDEADALPPGPHLAGLTEEAVLALARLSDDELTGVLRATRRQIAREQYKQVLVTAEFGRRRQAEFEDAARRGIPVGCRPGWRRAGSTWCGRGGSRCTPAASPRPTPPWRMRSWRDWTRTCARSRWPGGPPHWER